MSTSLTPETRPAGSPIPRGGRPVRLVVIVTSGLLTAMVLSVLVGSTMISPTALWSGTESEQAIVAVRVTRTVLALLVGAALGAAGACLQGMARNPLADPGLLGINAGASFAMILALALLGLSDLSVTIWFAFAGAAVVAVAVHLLAAGVRARSGAGATPVRLVVAGAAFSALLTSWTSAVLLVDREAMETFRFWAVGTVGGRTPETLAAVLPFLLAGLVVTLAAGRLLDGLALGDDLARGLGRHPARDRLVVGVGVVLLSGAATAAAGPIAFVGLVAPHAARLLVGPSHTRLVPTAAVLGACLTTLADTLGRIVLPPTEVQVGIMTAIVGAPVFVVLLRRNRVGAL